MGVKVGDVFTYQLVGFANSHVDFDVPENFVDINNTKYYQLEITKVEAPIVSYAVTWEFNNGTKSNYDGMINLEDGCFYAGGNAGVYEYYGIYAANLANGSLPRSGAPKDEFNPAISETQIVSYPDGDREIHFLHIEYEEYDITDQTFTRWGITHDYVSFDKQTGIMVNFKSIKIYNSPEIILEVEYALVSSNVLKVS
ncbi:MAG: hypothetical protein LBE70_00515 [Nitrososphaerota archaeon]|nr:hypothetical protein [Nitrososphaerota archaeon]